MELMPNCFFIQGESVLALLRRTNHRVFREPVIEFRSRRQSRQALIQCKGNEIGCDMRLLKILPSALAAFVALQSPLSAESVAVTCSILPDGQSASASLANPFDYEASCLANCKFSTAVYDDNPQVICTKPVPAGKEVEMCVIKAADNKLLKVVEGLGDCRKP